MAILLPELNWLLQDGYFIARTAEVLPIELDEISKLKVEVLFSKGSELARTHKLDKGLSWQKRPSSCV